MSRVSAVKSVVDALKAEILAAYKPGDFLPNERLFAEKFEVSRNTVREALVYLEAYGIVEKTQRGPKVTQPNFGIAFHVLESMFDRSLETCRDIIKFRRLIEIGTLPDVIEKITDEEIDRLEVTVARMAKALTIREAAEADYTFHMIMVEASGNAVVRQLYRVLAETIVFYMEIGKAVPRHDKTIVAGHGRIVEALRKRDYAELLSAADGHYDYSEGVLNETIAENSPETPLSRKEG
ncbi:FadR/GntR family transcriptional regulator [Pelagibacterium lentulum]|uniref:GntR family transcriptional regulator n=1 Tax=Pelagibacterium lentulum TaxID=2029865 RepID=A0A916W179_9HYPH|nr:FCD domain-containing protein [Pelagibacterium lentulum]GGA59407.1 GntR family transcriptional regulator [Pelagibacterium lentulum]